MAENMVTSFDTMQPSEAANSVSAALPSEMHMQSRLKTGWQTAFRGYPSIYSLGLHRSLALLRWHAFFSSFAAMRVPMHGYTCMEQAAGQATMQAVIEPAVLASRQGQHVQSPEWRCSLQRWKVQNCKMHASSRKPP